MDEARSSAPPILDGENRLVRDALEAPLTWVDGFLLTDADERMGPGEIDLAVGAASGRKPRDTCGRECIDIDP